MNKTKTKKMRKLMKRRFEEVDKKEMKKWANKTNMKTKKNTEKVSTKKALRRR